MAITPNGRALHATRRSAGATKTAADKSPSGKYAPTKARFAKADPAKRASAKAAAHILSAAKGQRTVSHRKIKEAVDKVFRERSHARA